MASDLMELDGPSFQEPFQAQAASQASSPAPFQEPDSWVAPPPSPPPPAETYSAKKRKYAKFAGDNIFDANTNDPQYQEYIKLITSDEGYEYRSTRPEARQEFWREFYGAPPVPAVRAVRRVGGMFVTLYTILGTCLARLWALWTEGATKKPQEIIAVETDSSGKKRRAVSAEPTSRPSKKKTSPAARERSVVPGGFPEIIPQETVKHDSPMEFELAVPQENAPQQTEQQTTDPAPISMPEPQESEPQSFTMATTTAVPEENEPQQTEQQTAPAAPISAPEPQESALQSSTITTTTATAVEREDFDWMPKGPRLKVKTTDDYPPEPRANPAPVPEPPRRRYVDLTLGANGDFFGRRPARHRLPESAKRGPSTALRNLRRTEAGLPPVGEYNGGTTLPPTGSLRRYNGFTIPPPLPSQRRDDDIDALVSRARTAAIESLEQQAFRNSVRERKELEEKEAEEAEARLKAERDAAFAKEVERYEAEHANMPMILPDDDQDDDTKDDIFDLDNDTAFLEKQKLIRPLDSEWNAKVDKAMETRTRSGVVCTTADGTDLKRHDFGSLLPQTGTEDSPSGWLNDEIVNAWMSTIVAARNKATGYKKAPGKVPDVVAYSSMWYTNYKTKKGIESIKNWSRRKNVNGKNLLKAQTIFFPVNTGAHWMLLVISPKGRKIEFLDSLGSINPATQKRFFKIAREWLQMELGDEYVAEEWKECERTKSVEQDNSDDCGVFVCMNALASAKGYVFEKVRDNGNMRDARRLMAAVLLNGGLEGDFEL